MQSELGKFLPLEPNSRLDPQQVLYLSQLLNVTDWAIQNEIPPKYSPRRLLRMKDFRQTNRATWGLRGVEIFGEEYSQPQVDGEYLETAIRIIGNADAKFQVLREGPEYDADLSDSKTGREAFRQARITARIIDQFPPEQRLILEQSLGVNNHIGTKQMFHEIWFNTPKLELTQEALTVLLGTAATWAGLGLVADQGVLEMGKFIGKLDAAYYAAVFGQALSISRMLYRTGVSTNQYSNTIFDMTKAMHPLREDQWLRKRLRALSSGMVGSFSVELVKEMGWHAVPIIDGLIPYLDQHSGDRLFSMVTAAGIGLILARIGKQEQMVRRIMKENNASQ